MSSWQYFTNEGIIIEPRLFFFHPPRKIEHYLDETQELGYKADYKPQILS